MPHFVSDFRFSAFYGEGSVIDDTKTALFHNREAIVQQLQIKKKNI